MIPGSQPGYRKPKSLFILPDIKTLVRMRSMPLLDSKSLLLEFSALIGRDRMVSLSE